MSALPSVLLPAAGERRQGPDFLCIGAQKAGTTWLYEKLSAHPKVNFPGRKEVHFWDLHYDKGTDWYSDLYAGLPGPARGDITPAYAILPRRMIRRVRGFSGELPIIFIMRNPIERAWSLALMNLRMLQETRFEGQAIQPEHLSDEFFRWQLNLKGNRARSNYSACLRNWFEFFPRDNFLLLDYQELLERPRNALDTVSRHIGVDPSAWDDFPPGFFTERVFAGEQHPLRESLLEFAANLYRDEIDQLSKLLGQDYSGWYRQFVT
ncbi:sulfotransferase domain-containing protein [Microbulbifer zhoushanensis]|uniref:sulfotransferase domain-containing protein n=1 Tax=Microbulbifer zhoushanensis TaxID=2904254 RepID=UPI001F323859|nr:sulfotransferase domain-containing protein [Microbulbifer zhoushanensis]